MIKKNPLNPRLFSLLIPLFGFGFISTICGQTNVVLDIEPPEAFIISPSDYDVFDEGDEVTIEAKYNKKTYNIKDTYFIVNEEKKPAEYYGFEDKKLDMNLTLSDLDAGYYIVTYVVVDYQNNEDDDEINFRVDSSESEIHTSDNKETREVIKAHGQKCEETTESARPYRWQLDLFEDSGILSGTLQFHACPDGGYIIFTLKEISEEGDIVVFEGKKKEGLGMINLHEEAIDIQVFEYNVKSETITPNLVE